MGKCVRLNGAGGILLVILSFMTSCKDDEDVGLTLHDESIEVETFVKEFETDLLALNNSGVTGTASFNYAPEGKFNAVINAKGLAPDKVHPQQIHESNTCPLEASSEGDGLLTNAEGMSTFGDVLIPLDDNLTALTADNFPVANNMGEINYSQSENLEQVVRSIVINQSEEQTLEDMQLKDRTVVLHGAFVKNGEIVPPDTEGAKYNEKLPVACGEIKAGD